MNFRLLREKFSRIGARLQIDKLPIGDVSIDIVQDQMGEIYSLVYDPSRVDRIEAIDVRPGQRHLLLLTHRMESQDTGSSLNDVEQGEAKHKFLCGHDERHWFVAAIPGQSVSNVRTAMEALKPAALIERQAQMGLKLDQRNRRKNGAFVRQGEWFFLRQPKVAFPDELIVRGESLSRGFGSKPHVTEELVRAGGTDVYVNHLHPTGLTESELQQWVRSNSDEFRRVEFQRMVRDPQVFVRGKVRHADHKTIRLGDWHHVLMNRESEAPAARNVVFLD